MSSKDTSAIVTMLYLIVESKLKTRAPYFKQCVTRLVNARSDQMYAIGPYDRIPYGAIEADDLLKSVDITKDEIRKALVQTYYWPVASFNPRAAKDEITVLLVCILRYFLLKKDKNMVDLTLIYLSFSGKFYPSIHFAIFPIVEPSKYRYVMDYVMNNLTNKFEFKVEGNVLAAVRSVAIKCKDTYTNKLSRLKDEDVVYFIQQLHTRIKGILKNVAREYYKAYQNKDYITFNSDNTSDEDYHLADSDMLQAERDIERAISKIQSSTINYKYCKMAANVNVKTEEVKQILENILNDTNNMPEVRELVRCMIYAFYQQSKSKSVSDIQFLTYSIAPKANSINPLVIRIKKIVEKWLETYSGKYRKRKKRIATQNAYICSIRAYFAIVVHTANK